MRPDGRDILMSSDGSLILNNVKPSDEGTYTCNAYTGIYSVSATADVRVTKDTQGENKSSKLFGNRWQLRTHLKNYSMKQILLDAECLMSLINKFSLAYIFR